MRATVVLALLAASAIAVPLEAREAEAKAVPRHRGRQRGGQYGQPPWGTASTPAMPGPTGTSGGGFGWGRGGRSSQGGSQTGSSGSTTGDQSPSGSDQDAASGGQTGTSAGSGSNDASGSSADSASAGSADGSDRPSLTNDGSRVVNATAGFGNGRSRANGASRSNRRPFWGNSSDSGSSGSGSSGSGSSGSGSSGSGSSGSGSSSSGSSDTGSSSSGPSDSGSSTGAAPPSTSSPGDSSGGSASSSDSSGSDSSDSGPSSNDSSGSTSSGDSASAAGSSGSGSSSTGSDSSNSSTPDSSASGSSSSSSQGTGSGDVSCCGTQYSPTFSNGADGSPDVGGGTTWLGIANKYRSKYSLPSFRWSPYLGGRCIKTTKNNQGATTLDGMHHSSDSMFYESLAGGSETVSDGHSGFESAMLMWLCEGSADKALAGVCSDSSGQGGGHHDMFVMSSNVWLGCGYTASSSDPKSGEYCCEYATDPEPPGSAGVDQSGGR